MSTTQGTLYREKLFQEILNSLHQWPELERSIFCEAHYYGRSPELIARSFHVDSGEVLKILQKCQRRLHNSLESFLEGSSEMPSSPNSLIYPPAKRQTAPEAHARISSEDPIRHFSRKSA
jgi:hypothetical protein